MPLSLVLGGARSGKSGYAQRQAEQAAETAGRPPVFIATAEAFDDEMRDRIARHQAERGDVWRRVEAPLDLAEAVRALADDRLAALLKSRVVGAVA